MKRRFYQLLFILVIILGIGGCKNTKQMPPASTESLLSPRPSDKSPMSEYQSILQNKSHFFNVDAKKDLNINQLNEAVSDDSSVKVEVRKFTIVDLDKDDQQEVILWLAVNNNDDFGFEVLSYQDGVIYGYTLTYRAFMNLKDDGTFSFSSGAMDYGVGTLEFTDEGYTVDMISYSESDYDSNNDPDISYFVNHESATEEDFLLAINKQSEKTGVVWYDLTDDNIESLLSE